MSADERARQRIAERIAGRIVSASGCAVAAALREAPAAGLAPGDVLQAAFVGAVTALVDDCGDVGWWSPARRDALRDVAKEIAEQSVAIVFEALAPPLARRFRVGFDCDACGGPVASDYMTDDEVCGGSDGPGFFLCNRSSCRSARNALSVEARRAVYVARRACASGDVS